MISKARIKWIKSLEMRKYRLQHNAFVAEGPKLVGELLPYFTPLYIAATKEWLEDNSKFNLQSSIFNCPVDEVNQQELERASLLRTPQSVLAVFLITPSKPPRVEAFGSLPIGGDGEGSSLYLALDGVQDPGNTGTILRIADWFGIRDILCSEGTADVYNPKCVQACMGALARVKVHYCNLAEVLENAKMPVYGTFLDGTDIYKEELSDSGIIVMGNEGNGISSEVAKHITRRLLIPNYPKGSSTTESLNVAVATGIVCAEFRRRV